MGKPYVTKALFQALVRYFYSQVGENPDDCQVLIVAPTGKAAHNINGSTLHGAFHIPASQGYHYKSLTSEALNTLRCHLNKLEILFIDEISMLQPAFDQYIFCHGTRDYSSLASNLWQDNFKSFELEEIIRQKDVLAFAELLNRLRDGRQTSDDVKLLKARAVKCVTSELKHYGKLEVGDGVILSNFTFGRNVVLLQKRSQISLSAAIDINVPSDIETTAKHIIQPPEPVTVTIKEARKRGESAHLINIVATVDQDEQPHPVSSPSKGTINVRNITLTDSSGEKIRLTLWQPLTETNFQSGG
ncbi:uncharacterized protein LOC141908380 [Tubulanus polymorphus]|uniref:uncharacterized protein LOC141908380 n=1 Tax=Tubulanus polymorphus TaxID=672921 RepID=UPI003DA4F705